VARQQPLRSNWDPATLHSQDAPVADGDAEDVGSEVLGALRPSPAGWQCTTQRGQPFLQAQTARVDRAQADAVAWQTEAAQDALHFVHAEHDGQGGLVFDQQMVLFSTVKVLARYPKWPCFRSTNGLVFA